MKVAYYSPLPPERSGIADYSALLLPALERLIDVEVIRRGRTRPVAADIALYHVGNDPEAHGWIIEALNRRPGVVVLHDFVLHHLVAGLTLGRRDGPAYLSAMERDAGIAGRLLAHGVLEGRVAPVWETRPDEFPLTGDVLRAATGLIVHSRYVETRVRDAGFPAPIWRIPHPAWPMPDVQPTSVDGRPIFAAFGHLNASKRIPQLLDAFAVVRNHHSNARLLLVGPASPNFDADRFEGDGVDRIDYVPEDELWSLMAACDACVSLRAPTMGETSGSAIRALTLGRPLIVSDVGWFAELPDDVALKVPVDDDEVPALATALELIASSEATQRSMSDAAREYVAREHDLDRVAQQYAAALEEAAGGTAVSNAVVDEVARAAAEVGIAPSTPFATELTERLHEVGLTQNGRPEPPPSPRESPLTLLPVWAWLAGIVLMSFGLRWWLAGRVVAPWIMVDELVYAELAKSFAATGHLLIRGEHHGAYGFVYPLVISPAYKLFASAPSAYAAAKAIGSLTMSLAAIPAYFLARTVLGRLPALAAALLSVALPSLVYTGTLMTENAFYPVFLCVALALVLALERPTPLRQVVVLAVCLLAFLTRTQAVAVFVGVATAPIVLQLLDRRQRVLRRFALTYAVLAAAVVTVLVVQFARGKSPYDVLGSYSVTGHAHYRFGDVLRWLVYHIAELDLYVGIVPLAAFLLLATVARRLDRRTQIFVAAAIALTGWLVLEVSAFASRLPVPPRVEERNMFYVAPLLLIALLVWIERGMPRPARAAAVCAAVAAALPGVLPYDRLLDTPAQSDTLALLPLWWFQQDVIAASSLALLVVAAAIVLASAFLLISPRWAYALPLVVLAWFVFANERIEDSALGFPKVSRATRAQAPALHRDWIDRAVGSHANVAYLWNGENNDNRALQLWQTEFFNRSVRHVYDLGRPGPGDLPESPLTTNVRAAYTVSEPMVRVAGDVVRRTGRRGLVLVHADQPVHLLSRVTGVYRDRWSGERAMFTRYRCAGGFVTAVFASDSNLFKHPQTVTAAGRRLTFAPSDATHSLRVPLHRNANGTCSVTFSVSPTAVPADVLTGSSDERVLGVRFTVFRYTAP